MEGDPLESLLERYYQAVMGKEPDQVPVVLSMSEPTIAAFFGVRLRDLYFDPAKMLKYQLKFIDRFPQALYTVQSLWPRMSGPGDGLVTAFGCELVWPENDAPWSKPIIKDSKDIDNLKIPDPHKDGRLPVQLEALRYYMDHAPEEVRERYGLLDHNAYYPGLDYACLLMGYDKFLIGFRLYPEKIHKLCEMVTDLAIDYVRATEEITGKVTKLFLSDHSPTMMSRKEFETFSLPYLRKVVKTFSGAIILYHNEGNVRHLLDLIPEFGADIFHFGHDIDVLEAKKKIGDKMCLMGNINSVDVMVRGTPEIVENACREAILKGGPEGGYVLSPSGGLAAGTPPENIDAMVHAAEKYGKYPIKAEFLD